MCDTQTEDSQAKEQRTTDLKKLCRRIIMKIDEFDESQSNQNELLDNGQSIGLAIFIYMRQEEKKLKQKYPNLEENQITMNLFKKWQKMNKRQKLKYIQKVNYQYLKKMPKKDRKQQKKKEKDNNDGHKTEQLSQEVKNEQKQVDKLKVNQCIRNKSIQSQPQTKIQEMYTKQTIKFEGQQKKNSKTQIQENEKKQKVQCHINLQKDLSKIKAQQQDNEDLKNQLKSKIQK